MSEGSIRAETLPQDEATAPTSAARADDRKSVLLFSLVAGIIGGLCCLTPIVLVMLGLATISVAADLGNVLYGKYRWLFRLASLAFLAMGLAIYFRRRGICSLEQARREWNRIANFSLLVLLAAVGIYIFWTYVVLHYWGIAAGLPWSQYSETWAIPTSAGIFAILFLLLKRTR